MRFEVSQEYGAHGLLMLPEQAPFPSQDFMPDNPSPSQAPVSQIVPATNRRQPPFPSQVPSCPQVAGVLALHVARPLEAAPAGMNVQSPSALGRLQALQLSPHTEVQQTPSAQNPERHSLLQEQRSLFPLLGEPASAEHAVALVGASTRESLAPSVAEESLAAPSRIAALLEGDLHPPISTAKARAATTQMLTRRASDDEDETRFATI